jgi:hypothetical protein
VSIFAYENEEIVGNPKPQIYFDYMFQRIRVIKNQWRNLSPQMKLKTKQIKNLNVYEHFSTMV